MANRGLDLTIEEELLENPSRRRFLKNTSIAILGLASSSAHALDSHFGSTIEDKDKIEAKFYNRTPDVKREYAQVHMGVNPPWPANFNQHQSRTGRGAGGLPGIDYYAHDVEPLTEIASSAKGIVYAFTTNNQAGMSITIYHGLGYLTAAVHLRERFARGYENVPRGAIIGAGGGAGTGGEVYPHIHFNTFGPVFTPYLKNVTVEPWSRLKYPYRYPADGEQFSIDNSGKLPYINKGDFNFDDVFWKAHFDAVSFSDDVLKEIGTEEAKSMLQRTESERRVGVHHGVDVRLLYLYELINQGKSPLSKDDNEKARAKLIEYMSTTPALTAPIKNEATPDLYRVLREKPLYTWEMWLRGKR